MKLFAQSILVGNEWQENKTIVIDKEGYIQGIHDGKISGAECLEGAVIPGMVNCHSHAFQRAFAGFTEYRASKSDSFWSWRDIMYRFVMKLSPEDVSVIAKFLYMEMLKAGYTCVAEFHYLHHQQNGMAYDDPAEMSHQVIEAAKSAGIGLTHLPVLYTYAGFGQKSPQQSQTRFIHQTENYCRLIESLCQSVKGEELISFGVAPHSLRAVSKEQLDTLIPFTKLLDPKAPIHIHIAEQLKEVDDCLAHYGKRPVQWLLENYQTDSTWCLVHATHLSNTEMSQIVDAGAIAGICPTTEANLGDGIFPTNAFLNLGGKVTIGSDSNIAVNISDELRTLEYAQRLTLNQRAVLAHRDCESVGQNLYAHAALQGASIVNQNVGSLEVGKRADLLVLNMQHPSLYAKQSRFILDAAIFACNQLPVKDVMVAGEWRISDGRHYDEESMTNAYMKLMGKLGE